MQDIYYLTYSTLTQAPYHPLPPDVRSETSLGGDVVVMREAEVSDLIVSLRHVRFRPLPTLIVADQPSIWRQKTFVSFDHISLSVRISAAWGKIPEISVISRTLNDVFTSF